MLLTCFLAGYAVIYISSGGKYICKNVTSYLLAGVCVATVYAEAFSLFAGVGLWANVILIALLAIISIVLRHRLCECIKSLFNGMNKGTLIGAVILFLLFAYGTSHGIMHYDSDLYHAQSIRWIEEFGVVKGLGNLHTRLAYNSAAFCLSALYSMKFLGMQSFHTCAGFLAWILAVICGKIFNRKSFIKVSMANIARIVGIYYLLMIFDEMVSPASDYFMVILVLGVIILFLDMLEAGEKSYYPYGMLSLATLVILSVKISGAFIVLLVIYPAYLLLKEKKYAVIGAFIGAGLIVVLPFILRNVILSGYLVYPFPSVDVIDVEYKIPVGVAEYDSREIQVYGRGYTDVTRFEEPIGTWLPDWFRSLGKINKAFFILALAGIPVGIGILIYLISKKKTDRWPLLLVSAVIDICFIFWMCTSPNLRYGCLFLFMAPALSFGLLYTEVIGFAKKQMVFSAMVILFFAYKTGTFGVEVVKGFSPSYMLYQQDYGTYEVTGYDMDGVTIYIPTEGNQVGYEPFPSAPFEAEATLMGTEVKDGFKSNIR